MPANFTLPAGPLSQTHADALNALLEQLSALLAGFTAAPPLAVSQDGSGVNYRLDREIPDVTVEAADGAPSYAETTTLEFDEADGYSLSSPSAGVVRIDHLAATQTQAGIVSLANQTVGAGSKMFTSEVRMPLGWSTRGDDLSNDLVSRTDWLAYAQSPSDGGYTRKFYPYPDGNARGVVTERVVYAFGGDHGSVYSSIMRPVFGGSPVGDMVKLFTGIDGDGDPTGAGLALGGLDSSLGDAFVGLDGNGAFEILCGGIFTLMVSGPDHAFVIDHVSTWGLTADPGDVSISVVTAPDVDPGWTTTLSLIASHSGDLGAGCLLSTYTGFAYRLSRYAVADDFGTTKRGEWATVSGLTFCGGLYTEGDVTAAGVTVGTTVVTGSAAFGLLYADGSGLLQNVAPSSPGQLIVSGSLAWVTMGGDATIDSSGVLTVANLAITTAKIAAGAVTYAKVQDVSAAARLLGRGGAAGSGVVQELTVSTGLSLAGTALACTITQYTDELAQDAVGGVLTDTSSIDFTYDDAGNTISAAAIFGTTSGTVCQGDDSRLSDARAPAGAAGGDLFGTYPSPRVRPDPVTVTYCGGL